MDNFKNIKINSKSDKKDCKFCKCQNDEKSSCVMENKRDLVGEESVVPKVGDKNLK